jgi:hypothetical protein
VKYLTLAATLLVIPVIAVIVGISVLAAFIYWPIQIAFDGRPSKPDLSGAYNDRE